MTMKNPSLWLCLFLALPIAPVCNASDSSSPLSLSLGRVLNHLDQDQSRKLTRQGDAAGKRFNSIATDQVTQVLSRAGATKLILLGTRGRSDSSSLSIERVLKITDGGSVAAGTGFGPAYQVGPAESADLGEPLAKLASNDQISAPSTTIPVEPCSTRQAGEALKDWKGVRYVASLQTASGSSPPTLKQLLLIPDSIRISIDGDAPASVAAAASTNKLQATTPPPANPPAPVTPASPATAPHPPMPLPQQDFEQHRQEQLARMEEERKRMQAEFDEQVQKEKEEEPERERKQMELEEQERQTGQQ
jgi:hypothetical protein